MTVRSLFDLDVAQHSAHLGVGELSPVSHIEASKLVEDVVRDHTVADASSDEYGRVSFHEASDVDLGGEHVSSADSTNIGGNHKPEGVPACLIVIDSELLSISKELNVLLNIVSSLKSEIQAQLLLSLEELIDIIHGSGLLATEWKSHVGACGHALLEIAHTD